MSFYASNDRIHVTKTDGSLLFDTDRPMLFLLGSYVVPTDVSLFTYATMNSATSTWPGGGASIQTFSGTLTTGINTNTKHIFIDATIRSLCGNTNGQYGSNLAYYPGQSNVTDVDLILNCVNMGMLHQGINAIGGNTVAHTLKFTIDSSGNCNWNAECRQSTQYPDGFAVSSSYKMRSYSATLRAGSIFYFIGDNS